MLMFNTKLRLLSRSESVKWQPSVVKELARGVEFETICVGPSVHTYSVEWFKEFRQLSRITFKTFSQFAEEVGTLDLVTSIDENAYNSWFKSGRGNRFPNGKYDYLDTWHALISAVCEDEALAEQWLEAFKNAESLPRTPLPKPDRIRKEKQETEQVSTASISHQDKCNRSYLFIGSSILVIISLALFFWGGKSGEWVAFEGQTEVNTNVGFKENMTMLDSVESFDTKLQPKFVASDKRFPGLINQIYLIGNGYNVPPAMPTGDIIGEYVIEDLQLFGFNQIKENPRIMAMISDRGVGSFYSGQIKVAESGIHVFSLDYTAGNHLINQIGRDCLISLGIGNDIKNWTVPIGLGEKLNLYYSSNLHSGYHNFSLWIVCEDIRGKSAEQHLRALVGSSVSLSMKSPNSAHPVKVSNFLFSRVTGDL